MRRFATHGLAAALLLTACATVEPPGGGPEDKLPPRVAGISPAPNATGQSTALQVTLQFDEWIASAIPRSAVSLSPPIEKKMQFEVDGDKLSITSDSPLDTLTTYTLTITSGLKDLRNNSVVEPFQLVFSTGPVLDSLRAEGRVLLPDSLRRQKSYPAVGLFPLGSDRKGRNYLKRFRDSLQTPESDTVPRLHKEPPLFLTHADSLGQFKFQGLRPGLYQVVAFTDLNGNQRVDMQAELAGVGEHLLRLDSTARPLWLTLGDQDTASLRVEGATQRGNRLLELAFSRNPVLDSAFFDSSNCSVGVKGSSAPPLRPRNHYQEPLSGNVVFVMDSLAPDSTYLVKCVYAKDSLGRSLDKRLASAEVVWDKMTDTVATRVSQTIPVKGARAIWTDAPIELAYNNPVGVDSLAPRLRIVINQDTVAAVAKQKDAVRLEVRSSKDWPTDAQIRLLYMEPDTTISKPDSLGKVDTLVTYQTEVLAQFETISKLKMANLEGTVPGGNATTRIRLRSTERKNEERFALCDARGHFKMVGLLEGFYTVDYFHDRDGDGKPSPGRLFPVTAGEPWRAPENELVLPHGEDNIFEKLLLDLPQLPSSAETP